MRPIFGYGEEGVWGVWSWAQCSEVSVEWVGEDRVRTIVSTL